MKRSDLRNFKLYPVQCIRMSGYKSDFCNTCKYKQKISENYIYVRFGVPMIKRNICQSYKRFKNESGTN